MSNNNAVLVDHYRAMAQGDSGGTESYGGLPVLATRGLHEHAFACIREAVAAGGKILELGAGTGAMSQRLADSGYEVCASDVVAENFRASGTNLRFEPLDLNEAFGEKMAETFDAVVAIEIIEHLENPRHLVREIHRCLRPGGFAFISTPNICNSKSLALFLKTGRFDLFLDRHYAKDGHIMPVPWFVLRDALRESGFGNVRIDSFKSAGWDPKALLGRLCQLPFTARGVPRGKILVASGNKTGAAAQSAA